jgi:hypothetical protein
VLVCTSGLGCVGTAGLLPCVAPAALGRSWGCLSVLNRAPYFRETLLRDRPDDKPRSDGNVRHRKCRNQSPGSALSPNVRREAGSGASRRPGEPPGRVDRLGGHDSPQAFVWMRPNEPCSASIGAAGVAAVKQSARIRRLICDAELPRKGAFYGGRPVLRPPGFTRNATTPRSRRWKRREAASAQCRAARFIAQWR